ncbi:unnamed protein product [Rotaria sp. Silwood1]|nr:unnamed protein product [Rotaria sp. Silwood1]
MILTFSSVVLINCLVCGLSAIARAYTRDNTAPKSKPNCSSHDGELLHPLNSVKNAKPPIVQDQYEPNEPVLVLQ